MKRLTLLFTGIFLIAGMSFAQTYVGPEKCLQCHNNAGLGDATGWRSSMHANGYSVVLNDAHQMENLYGVVNDYDENGIDDFHDGLDFNNISSVFDPYKPNAPILSYNNGYFIQMGAVTHKVYLTYGGSGLYKQRYEVKINTAEGESADFYASPIQYNEKTHAYVLYHANDWYDETTMMPIYTPTSTLADASLNSRSFTKGCAGCHMTDLSMTQDGNGEWISTGAPVEDEALYSTYNNIYDTDGDGDLDQLNNGCENCHGPGGDHVVAPSATNIINPSDPDDMDHDQANNLCGMCHSRGKSLPNNTFSYPYNDDTMTKWAIGDQVADFYTDGGGYYNDDKNSRQHHQQFYDFYKSSKPTFEFHPVACFECHDVHNTVKHHIRTEIEEEDSLGLPITVATENDNNTLCLACHATHGDFEAIPVEWVADYDNHIGDIGPIVEAHTNHPYAPEAGPSRCSKCHNPKSIKSAINYDIHSHTFEPIAPEKTKIFVMPNACAVSCHMQDGLTFGIDFTNDNIGIWDEPSDIALADTLMHWYGPGGLWWDHVVSVEVENSEIPETYALSQNYPNPFNPTTQINFSVPQASMVRVVIYDIVGREVEVLVNEFLEAGNFKTSWNAAGYSTGIYFYRMETSSFVQVKKMILMK
ncbi:T9SS type A sorting domain-containing protein [Bacteroidota bacterium]